MMRSDSDEFTENAFIQVQARQHLDIVWAMQIMGFKDVDKRGMCFGFSATAVEYYYSGKLAEYDEVIKILINLISDTHDYFNDNEFTPEAFEGHLKALLLDQDDQLKQKNKLTIHEIFEKVNKFQLSQENFKVENCIVMEPIIGIYDITDLNNYLASLQYYINENISGHSGLVFLMSSSTHTVMEGIEPHQDPILFRDINITSIEDINYNSKDDLETIKISLELNNPNCEYLLCESYMIIPENNYKLLNCIKSWKQSDEYMNIHELSQDRITRSSGDGSSLLYNAVIRNKNDKNNKLIKEMFEICPDLQNTDAFLKALCFAIILEQKSIIEYFLQRDIQNIDVVVESKAHGYSFTPLQCAIQFKDVETAKEILTKNANTNTILTLQSNFFLEEALTCNKDKQIKDLFNAKSKNEVYSITDPDFLIRKLTLLHIAAFLGQTEIVDLLLSKDTKITFSDFNLGSDELAEAMGYHEIAITIKEKYKTQLMEHLTEKIKQKQPLSNQAQQAIQYLQEILKSESSLQKCQNAFDLFYKIFKLEQSDFISKSDYYKNQVSSLYKEYLSSDNTISSKMDEKIHAINEKVNLIEDVMKSSLELTSNNKTVAAAINQFESLVLSEQKLSQCELAGEVLKKIFQINKSMENYKKPSRFIIKEKTIHSDWEKLLDSFYTYIFNKNDFDFSQLNNQLQLCTNLLYINPNCLSEPINKVPQQFITLLNFLTISDKKHLFY